MEKNFTKGSEYWHTKKYPNFTSKSVEHNKKCGDSTTNENSTIFFRSPTSFVAFNEFAYEIVFLLCFAFVHFSFLMLTRKIGESTFQVGKKIPETLYWCFPFYIEKSRAHGCCTYLCISCVFLTIRKIVQICARMRFSY